MNNMQVMSRQQTGHAGRTSAVNHYNNLCLRIQALAQEIQDMILDFLIKVSLNPGKVYFGTTIGINVFPGLVKIPNHALHRKVVTTLFANNTWVLPQGKAREARLLRQLPQPFLFSIRSMELAFSWNDAWFSSSSGRLKYIHDKTAERRMRNQPVDEDLLEHEYYNERTAWIGRVVRIWYDKYDLLRVLPLEHLKLDFSAVHVLDDDWVPGAYIVSLLRRTFTYGLPSHVVIVASTTEVECTIRDIVRRKNRHLVHNRVCTKCEAGMQVP
ncbi:hypothetical protein MMC27_004516 [Xylographa pallens]|nr:hypothetical protein [Xylographa pallens]